MGKAQTVVAQAAAALSNDGWSLWSGQAVEACAWEQASSGESNFYSCRQETCKLREVIQAQVPLSKETTCVCGWMMLSGREWHLVA